MGWPHNQHRELYRVVSRLAQETGQPELNRLVVSASALHMNFYEDWFQPEQVEEAVPQVRELVSQLRRIFNS
jgi:LmbE family N-acetylglucosaminyl deacetylase